MEALRVYEDPRLFKFTRYRGDGLGKMPVLNTVQTMEGYHYHYTKVTKYSNGKVEIEARRIKSFIYG